MTKTFFSCLVLLVLSTVALAQNSNSSTTTARPRTTAANSNAQAKPSPKPSATPAGVKPPTSAATPETVQSAFNKIIDGIRKANVDLVMGGYLKDPSLVFFNYNGTTTKGWEQMHQNREGSYRDMKDVKLDIRDYHAVMLGQNGAVVTCLWTQTQTFKGAPDTASGRMTLVFKRVGTSWKAVHLHTSPDRPDPSRVPASEQTASPSKP